MELFYLVVLISTNTANQKKKVIKNTGIKGPFYKTFGSYKRKLKYE